MPRVTPKWVTELSRCEIFVFGSNIEGHHGGGAACTAYEKFGAVWGQGVGRQGQSYAIPTMHGGLKEIKPYVDEFIEYVKAHPMNRFLLTRVGCGIAGFTDEQMAPLFAEALDLVNVTLPEEWIPILVSLPQSPEKEVETPEVITEEGLTALCRDHLYEISVGIRVNLPSIRIRYVIGRDKFGYANFGNFFFMGPVLYVIERGEEWKEQHNQAIFLDVFRDECKGRGYVHRAIFAGINTGKKDVNGQYIYTGDVVVSENIGTPAGVSAMHFDSEYSIICDNHSFPLSRMKGIKRVGTVFYRLDEDDIESVTSRCVRLTCQGAPSTEELLTMAKMTPNFDKNFQQYKLLDILGAEFHWADQ